MNLKEFLKSKGLYEEYITQREQEMKEYWRAKSRAYYLKHKFK